jgi:hypothetical protein
MIKGQVSSFQPRTESGFRRATRMLTVWDFRIERQDDAGKPLPRVQVEMRGNTIHGTIANGDWVEVDANWREGKVVQTRTVRNLTSNSTVRAKGGHRLLSLLPGLLMLPFVIAVFALVIYAVVTDGNF